MGHVVISRSVRLVYQRELGSAADAEKLQVSPNAHGATAQLNTQARPVKEKA